MPSETITVESDGGRITKAGTSETITVAHEDGDTVLSLSCPDWGVSVGTGDTITVVQCSPEVITRCEQGPPGPPGPGGGGTGSTFIWDQASPATLWTIPHNLGQWPSVSVVDSAGNQMFPDVHYDSNTVVKLYFNVPLGGKAFLN